MSKSGRAISFEEAKLLQLNILDEVNEVCRCNTLKYSLAFGTLLGAIRHKGYIPWDDDLDIMMPYDDMCKLKRCLHSSDITFYDIDTDPSYGNPFGNICLNQTYRKLGRRKERGLGIDVYPFVVIPDNSEEESSFFLHAAYLQNKRKHMLTFRTRMMKYFGFCPDMGFRNTIKEYRDFLVSNNGKEYSRYYVIAGPLEIRDKMIYNENLFSSQSVAQFEGKEYPIIQHYDYFLRLRYGDYMKLPPEDQRYPYHGQSYFWK